MRLLSYISLRSHGKDEYKNNDINLDSSITSSITGEINDNLNLSQQGRKFFSSNFPTENFVVDSRVIDHLIQMNEKRFDKKFHKLYNLSSKKEVIKEITIY